MVDKQIRISSISFLNKRINHQPRQTTDPIPQQVWDFFMPKILNIYKEDITMIKGLAITPPVLGRISIGKIVEKNGKRLPEKDDQFTITSQIQKRMAG
jgi:hypothetical protein